MQKKQKEKQKPKQKKTTKKEKRMRKYRVIRILLKIFICMALLIGLTVYGLMSPIFNITEIKITGNEKFDEEEYMSLSGLNLEENIFNFRKSTIISNIKQNAYVDKVTIKRKLPSTIEITIEERKVSYLVYLEDEKFTYAYISTQGYILEKSNEKLDLTIITGVSTEIENIIEGNRLKTEDLEKLQNVIQIKDSMKSLGIYRDLTKIDITNKSNYILTFEKEGKEVYLGDISDLSSKLLYMEYLLNDLEGVPGTIYLNQDNVYFSPK